MQLEQLFASLAISSATFVGKAAFSYATSTAYKKLQSLLTAGDPDLELKKIQLDLKMSILIPILNHLNYIL